MNRYWEGLGGLWRVVMGVVLFAFAIPMISSADDSEEEPRLPVAMEVFLKKPKAGVYALHVHLTNMSQDPVVVYVHEFPWVPPHDGQWLKAFRQDGQQTALSRRFPLGKVGTRPVTLRPGESVQDTIRLNPRFPSLSQEISQYGVVLHWDCPPPGLKFVCQANAPQRLVIPKGDQGHPDVYTIDAQVCGNMERRIGLVSIPEDHEVLFLLTTEQVMRDLEQAQSLLYQVADYVKACHPDWTNSWGVSFFTDARYAGFLKDGKSQRLFEKGLWQTANIGQYSSQIRTLFRFPWVKKKSDSVYLSVYR